MAHIPRLSVVLAAFVASATSATPSFPVIHAPCANDAATTFPLQGVWKVVKVRTDPTMTISALSDDDPRYLGAQVIVTGTSIVWNPKGTSGKGTYSTCTEPQYPRIAETSRAYAVKCGRDAWYFKRIDRNTVTLNWYDGGVLTLKRASATNPAHP